MTDHSDPNARSHSLTDDSALDAAYREMAADASSEQNALEWAEGVIGDVGDQPWALPPDGLDNSAKGQDPEREDWIRLSQANLARAYGENEPEYPQNMVKSPNPDIVSPQIPKKP